MMKTKPRNLVLAVGALAAVMSLPALASSHREAPFTASHPTVDATDWYAFRAYGPSAPAAPSASVVLIANYIPLQDPGGGPNYYPLNAKAVYDMHIDNDGDAKADITYRFNFKKTFKGQAVSTGGKKTPIPLIISGIVDTSGSPGNKNDPAVNRFETYTVTVITDSGTTQLTNPRTGTPVFAKPLDYIGQKSIPQYQAYARNFRYTNVSFGACGTGKVFVGQRHDGFVVNLGEVFDLVNVGNPLGPRNRAINTLADENVTSLALQVPVECLTADHKNAKNTQNPVIGSWTTASLPQGRILNPAPRSTNDAEVVGGPYSQVSRLGSPLVNELVIGLPDKDRFNASQPADDAQFLSYVTHPSLPVLITTLYPSVKIPSPPRKDLVAAFLTGVKGLNKPANVTPGEMLRLNVTIPPKPLSAQNNLGFLGCDLAGFPNGRRPADDVVDIVLNVAEGAITANNPNNLQTCDVTASGGPAIVNQGNVINDGAMVPPTNNAYYINRFPYLAAPIAGSPNSARNLNAQ